MNICNGEIWEKRPCPDVAQHVDNAALESPFTPYVRSPIAGNVHSGKGLMLYCCASNDACHESRTEVT